MWKMPGGKKKMKTGDEFLFQQQYPPTLEYFTRQSLATLNFDGRKLLSQIKAPTLIINGTKDQVVSMKTTRELTQGIPGAKLILVEGDHLFISQDINLLLKPALEFLADTGLEKIQIMIQWFIEYSQENPEYNDMVTIFGPQLFQKMDAENAQMMMEISKKYIPLVHIAVREGIEDGSIRNDLDPQLLGMYIQMITFNIVSSDPYIKKN